GSSDSRLAARRRLQADGGAGRRPGLRVTAFSRTSALHCGATCAGATRPGLRVTASSRTSALRCGATCAGATRARPHDRLRHPHPAGAAAQRLLGGRGEARHGGRAATGADVSCPLLAGTPCVARSHPFYLFAIAAPLSLPPAAPRGLLLPPSFSPLIKPVAMHMAPDLASRRDGSTPAARIQRRASFRPCHNPSSRVMAAAQAGGG
ncbi:unnamed protein product, partial [Urochloa humidicola]